MTNNSVTENAKPNSSETEPPQDPTPDPRPGFEVALTTAGGVLAKVGAGNLRHPSPCQDYDAAGVASHLVAVLKRITAVARGLDPFSVPQEIDGLEPDGFMAAWNEALQSFDEVWANDGVLAQPLVLPFATLPGAVALAIYTSEILAHTWDLAMALDVEVEWDDQLVEGALATMQFGLPAEPRGGQVPFAPVVDVADDSQPIDRLVGWLGRQPDFVSGI